MSDHADLVFSGGPIFTANTARSRTSAVAVRGGEIVAVGPAVSELVGRRTDVVDLAGRLLVPGFIDAHVHTVMGGLQMLQCDLSDLSTAGDYADRVAAHVAAHPDGEWINGGGWSMAAFPGGTPTAAAMDAVTGGRPAFLTNRDGHGAWVNSRALELAGITADTPDPADGRIERDGDGNPTGTLHEGAMTLVGRLLPPPSQADLLAGLLEGQRYLHSLGVTGWQDAIIGDYADLVDPGPAYLRADADGTLTGRVVGALWWDRTAGLDQIESLVARREKYRSARFNATSIKIMQDGVAENFTAAMMAPYFDGHGHPTDNSGISFVDPAVLSEAVPRLDALGFQVHFHAIGDRAVRECLDAVEDAIAANGRSDHRHHIAHIQVIHPEDIPRFRHLDVAANMQMLWATYEPQMVDLTLPFLGEQRSAWQYPFGDLLRAGAVLAAGSDWSVSTPNPLAAIHTGVNRMAAPGLEEGDYDAFLPDQAIDLASALTAYTAGSARLNHLDAEVGTIEVGKRADLVVLDRDPFDGPTAEIGATRVEQTFIDGVRVFGG